MTVAAAKPDDASEQVPEEVVAEAKASFGRKAPGELAVLVIDSLLDESAPAADHRLRFEHPRIAIDVHVSSTASGSDLDGHIEPPVRIRVRLESATEDTLHLEAVADGTFSLRHIPHGVIRLHLTGPPGTPEIHTDWFRV